MSSRDGGPRGGSYSQHDDRYDGRGGGSGYHNRYGGGGGRGYDRGDFDDRRGGYDDRGGGRRGYDAPRGSGGGRGRRESAEEEYAKDDAPREQGFVASLKENFGFIKSAESEQELFFHYSEIRDADPRDFQRGTEVEFGRYYDARNGRDLSVRVIILPPGTIKTEELLKSDCEGEIVREMREKRSYDRSARREMYGGSVRLLPREGGPEPGGDGEAAGNGSGAVSLDGDGAKAETKGGAGKGGVKKVKTEWQFGGDDVLAGDDGRSYNPQTGDVVMFDVVKVLATKTERATNVRFVRAAPVPDVPMEGGFVEKVSKDNYGFIECVDRDDRLFFHFSEVMPSNHQISVGDEVLFVVAADNQGRNTAVRIQVQPRGSVSRYLEYEGVRTGVVEKPLRARPQVCCRHLRTCKCSHTNTVANACTHTHTDTHTHTQTRSSSGYNRSGPELAGGVICLEEATGEGEKTKVVKVAFEGSGMVGGVKALLPAAGDVVEFKMSMLKSSKRMCAHDVRVTALSEEGREMGVVTRVKEGLTYCFLRCCEREEQIFMHMSEAHEMGPPGPAVEDAEAGGGGGGEVEGGVEVDGAAGEGDVKIGGRGSRGARGTVGAVELHNGDEVSFNLAVSKQDGRLNAVRVVKLPKGTVTFEKELEGRFSGRVTRLPPVVHGVPGKKNKDKEPAIKGLISPESEIPVPGYGGAAPVSATDEGETAGGGEAKRDFGPTTRGGKLVDAEAGMITWTAADLSNPALVFEKGDTVEFALVLDKPSKKLRAQDVKLVQASLDEGQSGEPSTGEVEQGAIVIVRNQAKHSGGGYGLIQSQDGSRRVMFHFEAVSAESLTSVAAEATRSRNGAEATKAAVEGEVGASQEEEDSDVGVETKETGGAEAKGPHARRPQVGDEVEFRVMSHPGARVVLAVDVRVLPKGSVQFEQVIGVCKA